MRNIKLQHSFFTWFLIILFSVQLKAQRHMEKLNHGLVAVKTTGGVFVSWRVLAWEQDHVFYNIYCDGTVVNSTPVQGASNLLDAGGSTGAVYTIKTVLNGVEYETGESASVWEKNYINIPVRKINGGYDSYILNDASVGDLDGDGEYEIVVKRLATGGLSSDDYHYLEAYELDGTFLWAVNMGPNIYNDVEFNFLVWDFDCDGKAEVALRTSDGFIDGEGNNIGDANNDGIVSYRNSVSFAGYRTEGPDYLSVLDGKSGKELARAGYIPRGNITDWGKDDGGHRSTKCMFTVAYQDGKKPAIVISRGIYERTVLESWSFENGQLTRNWNFDSNNHPDYASQGYHNLTLGDVDADGKDEVNYGSMVVDDNGQGLYSTKMGHGDAQHLSDINPDRDGLEFFGCTENTTGGNYRDARTGEIFHYTNIGRDMGRAGCADITPDYPGMEMWGPSGFPFLSATGDIISDLTPPSSMNFFIWWDGDLTRELLDHAWYNDHGVGTIIKYNNGANTQLLYASGTLSDNWTKGNPSLSADILGDWREEVIWRTADNSALRLYTTTDLTEHRIYTLMHDPQYRAAIGWQPNSYNQPPHPGFFIGTDMDSVPPAPVLFPAQKVWTSGKWDNGNSASWNSGNAVVTFSAGDSVLFDISGDNGTGIVLEGTLLPGDIRVISLIDYVFAGEGSIDGTTGLTKAGNGTLTFGNDNGYTGLTRVWDGKLVNNGVLSNSKVLVKRFAGVAGNGTFGKGIVVEKYAGLFVSDKESAGDTLFVSGKLALRPGSNIYMDLSDDVRAAAKTNDIIAIEGDLEIDGPVSLFINRMDGKLSAGDYVLMTVSDSLMGSVQDIEIKGIEGVPFELKFEDHQLKLAVSATRSPGKVVWSGAVDNQWDLFDRLNWVNQGAADYFLGEDTVVFDDSGIETTIEIQDEYSISGFVCDAGKDYDFRGPGSFSGDAGLLKKGSGTLTIRTKNGYTGTTTIENGKIRVPELVNRGYKSGIGTATAANPDIVLNGGELEVYRIADMTTDRNLSIGEKGGAISVSNSYSVLTLSGKISGTGKLIKNGNGTLALKNGQSHKGTVINAGTIQLADDPANISGPGDTLIFNGGTLAMNDNSYSYTDGCAWHIVVPEGKTGTLKLDSRSSLTGKLLGAGKLILFSPWIRNDLNGDWSGFSGTIEIITDNDGGDWRINNNYGYENADVFLNGNLYAYNLKGATKIGTLSGIESASLASGTWNIGFTGKDAVFSGLITGNSAINKYGTGNWTLTRANDYSGATNVYAGTLTVNNTSGSGTGSGGVFVHNGALLTVNGSIAGTVGIYANATCKVNSGAVLNGRVNVQGFLEDEGFINDKLTILRGGIRKGAGIVNGPVLVKSGGILSGEGTVKGELTLEDGAVVAPGTIGTGLLMIDQAVVLQPENVLEIEVDAISKKNDVLKSLSSVMLDGTLRIIEINGVSLKAGDAFKILDANSIDGNFAGIEPAVPGEGLSWDLSKIREGIIGVKSGATSAGAIQKTNLRIYPNPGTGIFHIKSANTVQIQSLVVTNADGKIVLPDVTKNEGEILIDLQNQPAGTYLLFIRLADRVFTEKLIRL